jgi:hypothetical protein
MVEISMAMCTRLKFNFFWNFKYLNIIENKSNKKIQVRHMSTLNFKPIYRNLEYSVTSFEFNHDRNEHEFRTNNPIKLR